jgi:hypothetical protein
MARVITVQMTGLSQVRAALGAAFSRVERAVDVAVQDFASDIDAAVKTSIQRGPKTGRTYRRRGIVHTASAPGQPPATDTGFLVNSIYVERDGVARMTVGSRLAYAAYLEFGTRKIAPRPAWVPAVEKARPEFEAQMRAIIAGAVNASR